MLSQHRNPLSVGLVVAALIAIAVAVLADGFSDGALLVLAVGLLTAGYAARRHTRDKFLYHHRDNR